MSSILRFLQGAHVWERVKLLWTNMSSVCPKTLDICGETGHVQLSSVFFFANTYFIYYIYMLL